MTLCLDWRAGALQQALQPLWPGLCVAVLPEVDSTNTALLARVRHGDGAPCLLVAEAQTAGRGRLGRHWWAAPGESLTFSLGLPYAPGDWSGLSLAVGLAVAEALDPSNAHIGLKWPNDLWLRQAGETTPSGTQASRKLGGILIETTALPAGNEPANASARHAVIGIGLNIGNAPGDDPRLHAQFATGHAGVQALDPALDAPATLHRVAPTLLRALQTFAAQGLAPLLTRYHARDVLRGRRVQAGETTGTAAGIDGQGQLLVQTDVCIAAIGSGDVSVRPC